MSLSGSYDGTHRLKSYCSQAAIEALAWKRSLSGRRQTIDLLGPTSARAERAASHALSDVEAQTDRSVRQSFGDVVCKANLRSSACNRTDIAKLQAPLFQLPITSETVETMVEADANEPGLTINVDAERQQLLNNSSSHAHLSPSDSVLSMSGD